MNSSGIKRGLAVSAVSALAVAGIPALANTASAAVGDSFTVVSSGPALNGGTEGAVVTIRFKDGQIDPSLVEAVGTSGTTVGSEDTADQNVEVVGNSAPYNDPSNSAYDFADIRVAVTTSTTGDTATFRLFEDDDPTDGILEASEARQATSVSTAGPLASIEIAPMNQSTPQNVESGDYTVTLKDSAGRTTQLAPASSITVNDEAPVEATGVAADDAITSDEIATGVETFTADPNGAAVGEYDITLTQGAVTKTATLTVTQAAVLTAANIDIVTAADTWHGFGNTPDSDGDNTTTYVRVDQNTIRFDFDAANSQAGANVQLTVDGFGGVTFGGKDQETYTTTLDSAGNGSITVTADAATIQEGDGFDVDINGFAQQIVFERAAADSIDGESATYFCQDDSACTVTAVVLDQFGNPVTTGEVEASRTGGQNVDATPQRKPVGPDGTVDFTFTDTNPVDGGTDTVLFEYFVDQFDQTPEPGMSDSSTTIKYSATGQGSNYTISLDGENTEGANYDAGDAAIIPLTDTVADEFVDPNDEDATIAISGGEADQAVTLSVDNGALILEPGETDLSEGSSSVDAVLTAGGALPAGYRVIGTKSGLVTLTVDSAGRTETAPLTVLAQDDPTTARNVTLTAPATVPFGTTQITFTAVVTDAFGNPVPGVPTGVFNKVVSGPGFYQDGDAQSDANGQIKMNVRVDSGASGDVTLTVDGTDGYGQFGAAADRLTAASATKDGEGLPASSDVASATTTVESAPEKVNAALTLKGGDNGAADDSLFANAINKTEGAKVKLFRKRADGTWKWLQTGVMNAKGNYRFEDVADLNGNKVTRYKAIVKATALTNRGVGKKKVR